MKRISSKRKYWLFGPYRTITLKELEDIFYNSPEENFFGCTLAEYYNYHFPHNKTMNKIEKLLKYVAVELSANDTIVLHNDEMEILNPWINEELKNLSEKLKENK